MSFKCSHLSPFCPHVLYMSHVFFYYIICSSSEKYSAPDLSVLYVITYFLEDAHTSVNKGCSGDTKQADELVKLTAINDIIWFVKHAAAAIFKTVLLL